MKSVSFSSTTSVICLDDEYEDRTSMYNHHFVKEQRKIVSEEVNLFAKLSCFFAQQVSVNKRHAIYFSTSTCSDSLPLESHSSSVHHRVEEYLNIAQA